MQDTLKDAQALLQGAMPSRRSALRWGVGLSYAAAVRPTLAETAIRTPADGLTAGEINVNVGGFSMPAYRAQPKEGAGKSGLPTVIVLSEIFGVHAYIVDVVHRLAHAGYLAIAPELFVRQGDAQSYGEVGKLMSEVIAKVPDAQVLGDVTATADWAAAHGGDADRLAVTGYCWGGRQTWLMAAQLPRIKAAVAWYGRLVGEATPLAPRQPVDVAGELKAPVLGLYGGKDSGISLASIERMKAALAQGNAAAKASQFVVYPDAPHGFHADYRPSYREADAKDGWARMLAWFKQHGVAA